MKPRSVVVFCFALLGLNVASADPLGTAFTYQGRLTETGAAFNGNAEFQPTLWDAASGGGQVAANSPASVIVGVTNGLFVLPLDFGTNFPGAARWLQLEVRTTIGPFTLLTPRQPLLPVPYALYAANAGWAATAATAATAGTAANAGSATLATTAVSFSGPLTGDVTGTQNATTVERLRGEPVAPAVPLTAQHLRFDGSQWKPAAVALDTDVSGTLADSRLSANVALRAGGNTFTGDQIVSSGDLTLRNGNLTLGNGNVGIGTAAPPTTAKFYVSSAQSNQAGWTQIRADGRYNTTVNGTFEDFGTISTSYTKVNAGITQLGQSTAYYGESFRNYLTTADNGTLDGLYGARILYGNESSDPAATPITNNAYGLFLYPYIQTGTIQNLYDLFIYTPLGGGTLTNHWAVYQTDSTAKNYFAGNVGIGTTSPSEKLEVAGTVKAENFIAAAADPPATVIPVLGMVWIKPGTFIMGSPTSDPDSQAEERPQTVVTLTRGFWMGVHEVTQGEYQNVIGSNPSSFSGDLNRPVEQVSWNDATNYCGLLTQSEWTAGRLPAGWGYRLPTEAEWEYACRAGPRTTRFSYGDDLSYAALGNYAWYSDNSGPTTHPVEQKLGNPWGLMDMHGNVWEWCQDWYGSYPGGSVTDPQGSATGSGRVLRGGSSLMFAWNCRSALRTNNGPGIRDGSIGFRIVLAPGP